MSTCAYGYIFFSTEINALNLAELKTIAKRHNLLFNEETDIWLDMTEDIKAKKAIFQIVSADSESIELWFLGENCKYTIGGITYNNEKSLLERMEYIRNIINDFLCVPGVSYINFILDSCFEMEILQKPISIRNFCEVILKLYSEWNNLTPSFSVLIHL